MSGDEQANLLALLRERRAEKTGVTRRKTRRPKLTNKRDYRDECIIQDYEKSGYALLDGATGTNLFAKGLTTGDAPELWNVDQPDKITQLHDEFIDAGSDILLTNSLAALLIV